MSNEQPSSADRAEQMSEEALFVRHALNETLVDGNLWKWSESIQEKVQAKLDEVTF